MRIGETRSGCEGVVTRINLKTVKKVWGKPIGSFSPQQTFKELKSRVAKLPPPLREAISFVYPRKIIKEKGNFVSYAPYIPGKPPKKLYDLKISGVQIASALRKVGIGDWHYDNVIQHAKTKKLFFIDPLVF